MTQQSKKWEYTPYRETTIQPITITKENKKLKEFQDQLNDLSIKHLDVFLKLNPNLPKKSDELQRILGIEKMSHQEKKEFARQLEDHLEEKPLNQDGRQKETPRDFFEENTTVLDSHLSDEQVRVIERNGK